MVRYLTTNGYPELLHLPPLNTDPHHLAIPNRLQFGDADLDPRGVEVLEDDLRDVFGQGFQQREMPLAQHGLDVLRDFGVVQRVADVIGLAGAAVGQGNVEVELQGLRYALLPFIDADQRGDLEFAQKDDVHFVFLFQSQTEIARHIEHLIQAVMGMHSYGSEAMRYIT